MQILYLTYDGLNDPLGQSQILPYLEGLADKGHEITVISFEKAGKLKAKSLKLKAIPLKYHKSPPVLSTLYDLYLLRKAVKNILKNQQIDIIHCRSYITSLVGLWAKRKYGVKFIFDMRGFWADERVEGGLWNLNNPLFKAVYQYFKIREREFFLESDATISLTHNAKQEIVQNILSDVRIHQSADLPTNIQVIPTCADLNLFNPEKVSKSESDQLKVDLRIQEDDFVLLYLGSLGTWYMLDEMLDFFENLKSEFGDRKSSKFIFVTREQHEARQAIETRNLDMRDFIITSSPRSDVPKYISICDASIFFIIPTYSKKASAATKMGEIMAIGKPVITNTGWGDVDRILKKNEVGVLVSELSSNGYRDAIDTLINTNFNSQQIQKSAEELFSLKQGIEKYAEIYQKLCTEN